MKGTKRANVPGGRFRVLLVYPCRDPGSRVRTQFGQERIHSLLLWPLRVRGYDLAVNTLETLASLTPDWVDLTIVNENLDRVDFSRRWDLVAITAMVTNGMRACQIADRFRSGGVKVVMGGFYPHMVPEHASRHADAICTSEAEYVWPQILADARDEALKPVYRQAGTTDMGRTVHVPRYAPGRWLRHLQLSLHTSRGCPFDCEFCSVVQMLGHKMRYKTPEAVAGEVEAIYRHDLLGRVAARGIFFVDDNIGGDPKQFKAICRAILAVNRRYPRFKAIFGSQVTVNLLADKDALALMRDAGFYRLFVGFESTRADVLRSYRKFHNVAFDYDEAIARAREYGMEVIASLIFGTDADTAACFDAAFDFFDRNNVVYPYFNILTPIGEQWKRYLMEGRILTLNPRFYDAQHTVFVPMKMRPIELQQGFIALVDRVLGYDQIRKRLLAAAPCGSDRRLMPSKLAQMALYYKVAGTLMMTGDEEGLRFVTSLRPWIERREISMVSVLVQLDQHDFAVRNRLTLAEHRFNLDVPSCEERPRAGMGAGTVAAQVAASLRGEPPAAAGAVREVFD